MSLHIVQISGGARIRLIDLGINEGWSYRYLGDNEFVFTTEQLKKIKAKRIPFKPIDPKPKKRRSKARQNGSL